MLSDSLRTAEASKVELIAFLHSGCSHRSVAYALAAQLRFSSEQAEHGRTVSFPQCPMSAPNRCIGAHKAVPRSKSARPWVALLERVLCQTGTRRLESRL